MNQNVSVKPRFNNEGQASRKLDLMNLNRMLGELEGVNGVPLPDHGCHETVIDVVISVDFDQGNQVVFVHVQLFDGDRLRVRVLPDFQGRHPVKGVGVKDVDSDHVVLVAGDEDVFFVGD